MGLDTTISEKTKEKNFRQETDRSGHVENADKLHVTAHAILRDFLTPYASKPAGSRKLPAPCLSRADAPRLGHAVSLGARLRRFGDRPKCLLAGPKPEITTSRPNRCFCPRPRCRPNVLSVTSKCESSRISPRT